MEAGKQLVMESFITVGKAGAQVFVSPLPKVGGKVIKLSVTNFESVFETLGLLALDKARSLS